MPQHDLDIANASGAAFRADLNSALLALGTTMRGNNAPTAPQAGMLWLDDNTPSATRWTLSVFDGADWISLGVLDVSANRFEAANALLNFGDVAVAGLLTSEGGSRVWNAGLINTVMQGAERDFSGSFDMGVDPVWTTVIDYTLPDRAQLVFIGGGFRAVQTVNFANDVLVRARLITAGGAQLAVSTIGIASTGGTPSPFAQGGLGGFFAPPDQNGMRIQIQVAKTQANGAFNFTNLRAAFQTVRRI